MTRNGLALQYTTKAAALQYKLQLHHAGCMDQIYTPPDSARYSYIVSSAAATACTPAG
jgi:hypothetical protein